MALGTCSALTKRLFGDFCLFVLGFWKVNPGSNSIAQLDGRMVNVLGFIYFLTLQSCFSGRCCHKKYFRKGSKKKESDHLVADF